ncbi:MAG: hypothetical protein QNK11_09150 [Legionella sp.]|nr:hypothetical protein [Legionella sp.]
MLTLLLLVVFSAVFILFSEEMSVMFKRWYGVYWVRVIVPLLVISWIWIWNDEFIPLSLSWLQLKIALIILTCSNVFPESIQWVVNGLGLFVLASLPAWGLYWKLSRAIVTKPQADLIKRIYFFVWIFLTVVLLA